MLSRNDKVFIKKVIRDEFKAALFRDITIERKATGPGEVDGVIEKSTENLLDMLVVSIPQWQQSLGLVEDQAVKTGDEYSEVVSKVNAMVELLSSMQESVMINAKFAVILKETGLLEQLEKITSIEYVEGNIKAIDHESDTGQEKE